MSRAAGSPSHKLRTVLTRSLTSPLHIAVAVAGTASSVAFQLWPLAALGGLGYAALVAWDLFNPEFWKQATAGETRSSTANLAVDEIRDPNLRSSAVAVIKARAELQATLAANPQIAAQVISVVSGADLLYDHARNLTHNADRLAAYLDRTDVAAIRRELDGLRLRARQTSDLGSREQYERTIATREEQLSAIADIQAALERAHASMTRILATLEGLSARVVRMSAMDDAAVTSSSNDMNGELEEMNRELESFEEVLRHLQPT